MPSASVAYDIDQAGTALVNWLRSVNIPSDSEDYSMLKKLRSLLDSPTSFWHVAGAPGRIDLMGGFRAVEYCNILLLWAAMLS
jgi:hypothetical protein